MTSDDLTSELELGRRTIQILIDLASALQPGDLDAWLELVDIALPRLSEIGILRGYLTLDGPRLEPKINTDGTALILSLALVLRRIARQLAHERGADDLETALYDLRAWTDDVLGSGEHHAESS